MSDFDPSAFAAEERTKWNAAAAGWRKWWHAMEAGSQELNDRLVALAGAGVGSVQA